MSAHHHDEHHSAEPKPVSFTVPFFLAAAVIIITLCFLSLCDPKPHHAGHGHEAATEASHGDAEHHDAAGAEHHEAAPTVVENNDSMPVESSKPEAEPAHH